MISERLKEVREALGMSQQAMADLVGVSLRSQQNYEAGSRTPDADYLAAIAATGADVLYILTGQRNPAMPAPQPALTPRKAALLDHYDHLTESDKTALERHAFALSEQVKVGGKKGKAA